MGFCMQNDADFSTDDLIYFQNNLWFISHLYFKSRLKRFYKYVIRILKVNYLEKNGQFYSRRMQYSSRNNLNCFIL